MIASLYWIKGKQTYPSHIKLITYKACIKCTLKNCAYIIAFRVSMLAFFFIHNLRVRESRERVRLIHTIL